MTEILTIQQLRRAQKFLRGAGKIYEFSDTLGMSPADFSVAYKATTGRTPRQYRALFNQISDYGQKRFLTAEILEKAKSLLLTSRPIESIAREVGYANQGSFDRAFKTAEKISPHDYRKLYSGHVNPIVGAKAWLRLSWDPFTEIAEKLGRARATLADTFSKTVGKTPNQYRREAWETFGNPLPPEDIRQAQILLQDPENTIRSVRDKLGFESKVAFDMRFKRTVGLSPRDYRKAVAADPVAEAEWLTRMTDLTLEQMNEQLGYKDTKVLRGVIYRQAGMPFEEYRECCKGNPEPHLGS